jgi:histone H3/H4
MSTAKPKPKPKVVAPKEEPIDLPEIEDEAVEVEDAAATTGETEEAQPKTKGITILTEKAGLNFNVNWFDTHIRDYFETNDLTCPKVRSFATVAIAAVNQELCEQLIRRTITQLQQDKSNLYTITRRELKIAIGFDANFKQYFDNLLEHDDNTIYTNGSYCMRGNKFREYVDQQFGKDVSIPQQPLNLLFRMLLHATNDIIDTANQFIEYAKRKTMDALSIKAAVRNRFKPELAEILIKRATDAVISAGGSMDHDADDDAAPEEAAVAADGDVAKKAAVKTGKPGAKIPAVTPVPAKAATAKAPAPKKAAAVTVKDVTNEEDENAITDEEVEVEAEEPEPVKPAPVVKKAPTRVNKAAS